jgi:ankyrin repeat protein
MKKILLIFLLFCFNSICFANVEKWDEIKKEWSSLMIAIYKNDLKETINLIKSGADVNFKTPGIESAWKLTAMEIAIFKENDIALSILLHTNKIVHPEKFIFTAADRNNPRIINLLILYGAKVNDTLENGYSPLMAAASFGSNEVLECLLKHGANVKQTRQIDGITALMLAAFNGYLQKVKVLLSYKADKNIKDKNGKTALNYVDEIYPSLMVNEKTKAELRMLLK